MRGAGSLCNAATKGTRQKHTTITRMGPVLRLGTWASPEGLARVCKNQFVKTQVCAPCGIGKLTLCGPVDSGCCCCCCCCWPCAACALRQTSQVSTVKFWRWAHLIRVRPAWNGMRGMACVHVHFNVSVHVCLWMWCRHCLWQSRHPTSAWPAWRPQWLEGLQGHWAWPHCLPGIDARWNNRGQGQSLPYHLAHMACTNWPARNRPAHNDHKHPGQMWMLKRRPTLFWVSTSGCCFLSMALSLQTSRKGDGEVEDFAAGKPAPSDKDNDQKVASSPWTIRWLIEHQPVEELDRAYFRCQSTWAWRAWQRQGLEVGLPACFLPQGDRFSGPSAPHHVGF